MRSWFSRAIVHASRASLLPSVTVKIRQFLHGLGVVLVGSGQHEPPVAARRARGDLAPLEYRHARAALGQEQGAGHPRHAAADHDDVHVQVPGQGIGGRVGHVQPVGVTDHGVFQYESMPRQFESEIKSAKQGSTVENLHCIQTTKDMTTMCNASSTTNGIRS